jgi:hypothetical protein
MTLPFPRALLPQDAIDVADRHAAKVGRVAAQLRARTATTPVSIKKKAVSHQVPKRDDLRHKDEKIDVTDLDEILEIDPIARTCTAEAGVTFVKLVEATLRHGLVPIVVPELKTITIGGAVSGCSLESMSFKYGGFHDTCLEYEVITAKGGVMRVRPGDLVFEMLHGSFGTLGILSKLKFRLVPAKPFVEMTYETYPTLAAYKAGIRRHFETQDVDFMDGIIHSKEKWVLCLGRFVDSAPYTNSYDWLKVYWESTGKLEKDYLKTPDYFFRYDRGVTNVHPKSFIGRLLFGKIAGSSTILRLAEWFHELLPAEQPDVILDTFLPFSRVEAFMDWYVKKIDFFPIWCVPYRRVRDYEWIADGWFGGLKDDLFLDLAIYGLKQPPGRNLYEEFEGALYKLRGIKTLIAYNYYEKDVFWTIWNEPNYRKAKAITDPDNVFRDLYEKTCRAARGLT